MSLPFSRVSAFSISKVLLCTERSSFHLFHCYLGIVSEESSAFSCFVPTKTDTLSWCCKSSLPSGSIQSIVTGNLNTWAIFFPFSIMMCDIFTLKKLFDMLNLFLQSYICLKSQKRAIACRGKSFYITSTNTHGFKDALGPLRKQKTRCNSCSWMHMFPAWTH